MITKIIFIILANILFVYFFWRRLREDYIVDQIFTTAIYVILLIIVAQVASSRFFPSWWFWMGLSASVLGITAGIFRYKLRVVETFEAMILGMLPVIALIYLYNFFISSETINLIATFFSILLTLLFFVVDRHYRKFTWYKSGRIGFSGLLILGVFFIIRAGVAYFFNNVLSFSGQYEIYLSAFVAFVAFISIYTLARSKT